MWPLAVHVTNEDHPMAARLNEYLHAIGAGESWNADLPSDAAPDAVFSSDAVIPSAGLSEIVGPWALKWAMPSKRPAPLLAPCRARAARQPATPGNTMQRAMEVAL